MTDFEEFQKIARLSRECCISEKIDGTNAQVHVLEDGTVLAGSRNRYVTPEADNFGFARLVQEHQDELRAGLGIGRHFGEWWGCLSADTSVRLADGSLEKLGKIVNTKMEVFECSNGHRWRSVLDPGCDACGAAPSHRLVVE